MNHLVPETDDNAGTLLEEYNVGHISYLSNTLRLYCARERFPHILAAYLKLKLNQCAVDK